MSPPLLEPIPHLLLLSSPAPFGVSAYPHALQTGRWEENQRISKKVVDTFWKANTVTFLGIGCWAALNIWLLLLCVNGNWSVWKICFSSRYWASAKIFSFICLIWVYPKCCCTPLGDSTYLLLRAWHSVSAEGTQLYSLHGRGLCSANLRSVDHSGSNWGKSWAGCKGTRTILRAECTSSGDGLSWSLS